MSDPYDPFESPWVGGQELTTGKHLYEALIEQPDFRSASRLVSQLSDDDARVFVFFVAAEEIAKDVERLGSLDPWVAWWRGVDSPGDENPDAMDTTPLQLWKIMRPEGERQ